MNPRIVKDESEIPEGAVRVHLYNPKNVLMPRGSMKKESIAIYILDHLLSGYEGWTDKKYGDNPPLPTLIKYLYKNLMGEIEQAWLAFIESTLSGLTEKEELLFKMSLMAVTEADPDSEYVNWLLKKITSSPSLFVDAVCFIDQYERNASEFRYFTLLHMTKFKKNKTYKKMMDEALDSNSTIAKMFHKIGMVKRLE